MTEALAELLPKLLGLLVGGLIGVLLAPLVRRRRLHGRERASLESREVRREVFERVARARRGPIFALSCLALVSVSLLMLTPPAARAETRYVAIGLAIVTPIAIGIVLWMARSVRSAAAEFQPCPRCGAATSTRDLCPGCGLVLD